MKLKIRFLKLSAGRPVAILNKKTAERLNAHVDDRVKLNLGDKSSIAVLDVASGMISEKEIAVSTEVLSRLGIKRKQEIEVNLAVKPKSITSISKKLQGKELSKSEIFEIIKDIVNNALTEPEIAYFISAVYNKRMSMKEIIYTTEAIVSTGKKLGIRKRVSDKHSIGGLPGNRTTPILVSICSSLGLVIPKTSSRAITSAAGTADVIETLCKVDFSAEKLRQIVKKTNACFVWGGALGLAPADDKLIQVERLLNLDPESQLLASIMSKKIAAGSDYVLIDLPYGKTAKVNKKEALSLKKKFEKLGKYFKMKIKCVLTDGSQPIGNGVGPVLEMQDVLSVLRGDGPEDLKKKSIFLSGELLELSGKAKKGEGYKLAEKTLSSGKALKKFKEIIKAQQGKIKKLKVGNFYHHIPSEKSGKVKEIDNKKISYAARLAGCPTDKSSGLYLWKHLGEKVEKQEKLLTIYAESKEKLNEALNFYEKEKVIFVD